VDFGTARSVIGDTTKRPDKIAEIKNAINAAIEFYSNSSDWSNDLVETTVNINSTLYAQSLTIASSFTRFKKIKYIRPTGWQKYLTWWDPATIFDENQNEIVNTWYRSNSNIIFKLSTLASSLEIGYLQYHNYLVADSDTHWMLDIFPQMIMDKACERIFSLIGNDTESVLYRGFAAAHYVNNTKHKYGVSF
jgi:hypothetical protein